MAYAVDIDQLVTLCGSGDNARRRAICGRFREDISRSNDSLGCSNERGAPSIFTAIEHLVMGSPLTLQGHLYGYGFKYIVEFFGRFLDNSDFYPTSFDHVQQTVDPALAEIGATLRMSDLLFRGAPVTFPRPDDFPVIGYWKADEVAQNADVLRSGTTRELQSLARWLEQARAERRGIVSFYH
jgi:hypothetical protein